MFEKTLYQRFSPNTFEAATVPSMLQATFAGCSKAETSVKTRFLVHAVGCKLQCEPIYHSNEPASWQNISKNCSNMEHVPASWQNAIMIAQILLY